MGHINHLYIIGNGFDVFSGLKTRYIDFRWWLENNYIFVYEALVSIYGADGEWWNEFENQLGKLNVAQFIDNYTSKYKNVPEIHDIIRKNREFEKENGLPHNVLFSNPCASRLRGLLDILQYCFEKWVNNVQKCIINPKYTHLEQHNSYFINFNYTDTLELLYKIPEENILHIHGRAIKGEHLIFGHDKHLFGERETGHEGEMVAEVLNIYEKNPYMNIPEWLSGKIVNVKNIHVLGLSLSAVDIPYLDWIIENTPIDCKWEISWFSKKDIERIANFMMDRPCLGERIKRIQIKQEESI